MTNDQIDRGLEKLKMFKNVSFTSEAKLVTQVIEAVLEGMKDPEEYEGCAMYDKRRVCCGNKKEKCTHHCISLRGCGDYYCIKCDEYIGRLGRLRNE